METIILVISICCLFAIVYSFIVIANKINQHHNNKNKKLEDIPKLNVVYLEIDNEPLPKSYPSWHSLPASEIIGDFSGMKHGTKEWADKPLSF